MQQQEIQKIKQSFSLIYQQMMDVAVERYNIHQELIKAKKSEYIEQVKVEIKRRQNADDTSSMESSAEEIEHANLTII